MKKCLLVLFLVLFCHTAFGDSDKEWIKKMEEEMQKTEKGYQDYLDDISKIQIPFIVVQKSGRGKLTINQVYAEHAIGSNVYAGGIYENTTDTIFCRVDMRVNAFDHEGVIIGETTKLLSDSSYGLIKPGTKIKLEFSLYLQGTEAKKVKNVVFSVERCEWRDRDNPGLKKQ